MHDPNTPPPLGGHSEAKPPVIHTDPEPAVRDLGKPPLVYQPNGGPAAATDEAERQQAFDSAFAWHGSELHGFTSSRHSLFCQLRLAAGAEELGKCLNDRHAFIPDAIRILWLCSHTPKDWATLRADSLALQEVIDAWGDVNVPIPDSPAALMTALQIYNASHLNEHEAVAPTAKGHGDDLGN